LITLLDVLTRSAGLSAISCPVTVANLYGLYRMIRHSARSAAVLPAQSAPAYHNITYGHLQGGILCCGVYEHSLPCLLHQFATAPRSVDFRISPKDSESTHLAHIMQENPDALFRSLRDASDSIFAGSMLFFVSTEDFSSYRWPNAVIRSRSDYATAYALAILYDQLIWWDALPLPARQKPVRTLHAETSHDLILGIPLQLGQGLELSTSPGLDFGANPATIGQLRQAARRYWAIWRAVWRIPLARLGLYPLFTLI
jgi:hypothetical protein